MITREKLFDKIQREIVIEYCLNDLVEIVESGAVKSVFDKTYDSLQQHIKSLEVQLANTEQLTCDGCINKPNVDDNYDAVCGFCSRFYGDHYTNILGD